MSIYLHRQIVPDPTKVPSEEAMRRAAIPRRFHYPRLDGLPATNPARLAVEGYLLNINEHLERGKGVLLYGPLSSGKTVLACIMLRYVLAYSSNHCWFEAARRLESVMKDFRAVTAGGEPIKEVLCNSTFAVLDDVGQQKDSAETRLLTEYVIRERYDEMKPTFLTSNFTPAQLRLSLPGLQDVIEDSFVHIPVSGINWRLDAAHQPTAFAGAP